MPKYYPIPIAGSPNCTAQVIEDAKRFGLVSRSIGAVPQKTDMFNGMVAESNGEFKAWRDNQFLYFPEREAATYAVVSVGESFKTLNHASSAQGMRQEAPLYMAGWLNLSHFVFLAEYAVDFPSIPLVNALTCDKEEALRFVPNGSGPRSIIPMEGRCPSDVLPVFMPNGSPGFISISEYTAEFPRPRNSAAIGNSGGVKLSDDELVANAFLILSYGLTTTETATALRRLLTA